ncbi:hypothetical protein KUTeg_003824 [Tegillarca granosa]|uniref:Uncharacterized protein n=1 Tax=Tegillarca granosa TaxID=220873 RepID=A0ABQ9FSQ6_TEGGR|nr:hypothetical protein KUTeg_003824 [Tegillarca granosa]
MVFLGDNQGQITLYTASEGKQRGGFPAHPKAVEKISVLDEHIITLGKNKEMSEWSISEIWKDIHQTKAASSQNKGSILLNQQNICSFDVNTDHFVTASGDKIVRVWSIEKTSLNHVHKIGIKGDKLKIAMDGICIALDKTSGEMKIFNIKNGSTIFSDTPENCLDFALSKKMVDLYILHKDENGGHHISIVDLKLAKTKKKFQLKPNLKCETVDMSVNANEMFLILRTKCTQEELKEIEASWKKQGSFLPQYHPYRFSAVDLIQASGRLIPCYRLLSKIPFLGEVCEAYQGNVMMITTRRWVVFWDIPTGKCDQRVTKSEKKGMLYRPDWVGQDCKGCSLALVQSNDGRMVILAAGSPDNKWFVSACRNHIIKLWDTKTGIEVFSFRVDASVQQMKFSQDSKYLLIFTVTSKKRRNQPRLNMIEKPRNMRAERNTLAREVYPRLKEICFKYDLDFQVVDMRWGVTEDSQNDHSVEQICLTEIENCQNVSLGPNFVLITADRYGFQPLPTEIDSKEFETFCKLAEENKLENIDLIRSWYILDDNVLPPMYVLQPIRSKFPFYGDHSPGYETRRQKDSEMWRSTFSFLQKIVREAANLALKAKQISSERHHQYFLSVTEMEVYKGILKTSNPLAHTIVYHRKLTGLDTDVLCEAVAKRYFDVHIDDDIQKLKDDLMYIKLPNAMKNKGYQRFVFPWKPGGINPSNHKEHADYLESFCSSFVENVSELVNEAIDSNKVKIRKAQYYPELLHHLNFCKSKCETFCD